MPLLYIYKSIAAPNGNSIKRNSRENSSINYGVLPEYGAHCGDPIATYDIVCYVIAMNEMKVKSYVHCDYN